MGFRNSKVWYSFTNIESYYPWEGDWAFTRVRAYLFQFWSPLKGTLAYPTLMSKTICLVTCQGEGTGAPGWRWCLTGRRRCKAQLGTCGTEPFTACHQPQNHTNPLFTQPSLLPSINLKRRERSFTENFNIIHFTHAKPLTQFLTFLTQTFEKHNPYS